MIKKLIAFGGIAHESMRVDMTVTMQIKNDAHEWELKWQATGEFCNSIGRTRMLVRIKPRKIDQVKQKYIWRSGVESSLIFLARH